MLKLLGILSRPFSILAKSYSRLLAKYGGIPTNISYNKTPNKYQSTAFPCPYRFNISGARYATDPQKLLAIWLSATPYLLRPKSANIA